MQMKTSTHSDLPASSMAASLKPCKRPASTPPCVGAVSGILLLCGVMNVCVDGHKTEIRRESMYRCKDRWTVCHILRIASVDESHRLTDTIIQTKDIGVYTWLLLCLFDITYRLQPSTLVEGHACP